MIKTVKRKIGQEEFCIETGKIAKQANGAVLVQYGGSVVMVAVTAAKKSTENLDYFPLSVSYMERMYAAGKIPGGFFKREGKPTEKEILVSRLVDRPLRPLFPEGFRNEVQIVPMTLSTDQCNPPDILAINAASAALSISNIPFNGPVGAVRVGKVENNFIINPTFEEIEKSTIDLVVAGTKNGILMVEGSSEQISENEMVEALKLAHKQIIELVELQNQLVAEVGTISKMEAKLFTIDETLKKDVIENSQAKIKEYLTAISDKQQRNSQLENLYDTMIEEYKTKYATIEEDSLTLQMKEIFHSIEKEIVRTMILNESRRIDGRGLNDIREISCETGILPRTHGSALFTRGQTQSLAALTLGSTDSEQRFDDIEGEDRKKFMLHYSFPPFSVGETGRIGFTSRREIGHGMLAERSLSKILPDPIDFPYTIRIVSEILESNGSSSMASVCSGCLSLLDAGVPIKSSVAGVAMGLVMGENNKFAVLTDILGEEDHLGDMDFKVAGTANGITAFQMDIKIDSITFDVIEKALAQAKEGRLFILNKMNQVIDKPKESLSPYAPKIKTIQIEKEKIALVIGPSGRTIKDIIQQTSAEININDDGQVTISGKEEANVDKAVKLITAMVTDVKPDEMYDGIVSRITDFGAFVSLPGKKEGLVHISKISDKRVNRVEDVLKIGQEVKVKVVNIDNMNRINLTMKNIN